TAFLRQFFPIIPASLRGNPRWEISLNSVGFRDDEFPVSKLSSSFRVVCLGDSWTFGANVGQDRTYPFRLKTLLREAFPRATFEVLNLGVLGYTSYQGLELLRRTAIGLQPDLVVIGYGMNDATLNHGRDRDLSKQSWRTTEIKRIASIAEQF